MVGFLGEWQRGAVIGRGASATVSIAMDRLTGDVFAVKSTGIALAGLLRHEQSVLSALASPYVVACIGGDVSKAADGSGGGGAMCYDLFLELAPGGSLADETKRCGGRCEEPLIRSRAGDILRGLVYIHGSGVAHCDVKARNVLLGADGRAKLADFGCARWTADDCNAGGATIISGTPMFLAPEAARGEAQGTAADIWALGCTVIEVATGGAPWPRFSDPVAALHHVAHSGDVPEAPVWFSDEGKDFLARCLVRDPTERWTAEQLLEHPFVTSSPATANPPTPKATPMEEWVSPKSILDQGFWDHSSSTEPTRTVALTAADRLRSLASSAWTSDWTWSGEDWITVVGVAESTNVDTESGGRSSSGDEEHVSSCGDGGGEGPSHGHPGARCSTTLWRRADDSVISSCSIEFCSNSVSKSNGWHWYWKNE